jgi:23S rRNA (uridine2552-2'-O)-methyltransferase
VDQPKSIYLAELALDLAKNYLNSTGAFVVKLFQGEGCDELIATLRRTFTTVKLRKPDASRSRSSEIYAIYDGLR